MGRIIRMPGDAHREVQELLPWYVTGQLDPADLAEVEGHLKHCPECRAEIVFQQQLAREVPKLPLDVEHGWARMRRRLERERSPRGLAGLGASLGGWLGGWGPNVGGGAVAWPAFALTALLAMVGTALVLPALKPAAYHALGAAPPAVSGNVVVIFRPDTPEKALRETLRRRGARLVDGPTAADGYVLNVAPAERTRILAQLRAEPDVVLAEAIDPPGAR